MFLVLKKTYIVIAVILCILAATVPVVTTLAITSTEKPVIAIDAGHGGYDGGVTGVTSGIKESAINLALANLLKGYFESDGYKVVMTRTKDEALTASTKKQEDMRARTSLINKAAPLLLISLHVNFYPSSSRRGIQTFYTKEKDIPLAESLQKRLNTTMNIPTLSRSFSPLAADYYLLANVDCPSALVECGFFSNKEDEALLLDENYRMRLAFEIFSAIKEDYSLSK